MVNRKGNAVRTWKLTVWLGVVLLGAMLAGCGSKGRETEEVRTVRKFLLAMKDDNQAGMKTLISPAWLRDNGLSIDDYDINRFALLDHTIEKVEGNEVTVLVKFIPGAHRLVLRVTREEGRCYIEPGGANERGFIDPWVRVDKFVE